MPPTIPQSLVALLSAFPNQDSSDPESTARAYMLAVDDVAPEFVAEAVLRFIRGHVKRDKHTFLPSTAELSLEARRLAREVEVRVALAARAALAKPEDQQPAIRSPEERERVAKLIRSLAKSIS